MYIFNQHFDGFSGPLDCHIYCDSCQSYVGSTSGPCPDCDKIINYDESISSGNYFILFNIERQVKHLLEDAHIQSKISQENADLRNGKCYQQLPMHEDDLSVIWGSHGAAIFSSSNFSIWPLQLMVNELPYVIRRKHIHVLLAGLWFGSGKPNFDSFLKPIIEEMNVLSSEGLQWTDKDSHPIISKIFPGPLTCDSVARCQLQEIMQFNGKFGCSWCLHPGEQVQKGNGHTNVYALSELNQLPRKRDEHSFKLDCEAAVEANRPVHGVKRPSILLLICHFNIISGFVVDYMHTVCLGVARTLTSLWLESSGKPYYIGNRIAVR